jgi:YfiH family protein
MLLRPDWPAPSSVVALSTTRAGLTGFSGASVGEYAGFNLGDHVGDKPSAVAENRQQLRSACEGLQDIAWLNQVHGLAIVDAEQALTAKCDADASITIKAGLACAILTADCLPVLFCRRDGRQVAAAHAGWRGLCAGVLAKTLASFDCPAQDLMAWIGPSISSQHFEVGAEVRQQFINEFSGPQVREIESAFKPNAQNPEHFYADLIALASMQLRALGLGWVGSSGACSYAQAQQFYSFRRDGVCGRQASLIYIKASS